MRPRSCDRFRTILAVLAVSVVVSCANGPPRRADNPAILEIRDDYLRAHPTGRFNAEIVRGEVVVGMGYHDLLAAWGVPDARVAAADSSQERWTYVLRDDNEVDWVRYDFLFAARSVAAWETIRNVGSGFSGLDDDPRGASLRVLTTPAAPLGEGAQKGGSGPSFR